MYFTIGELRSALAKNNFSNEGSRQKVLQCKMRVIMELMGRLYVEWYSGIADAASYTKHHDCTKVTLDPVN